MADLYINKLEESSQIDLNKDYTVFDIFNNDSGSFFTKKVTLNTVSQKLTGAIVDNFQSSLNALQASLNASNAELSNKLDKRGTLLSPTNRMTGPLSVNSQLSVTDLSYFSNNVDVRNNRILNLNDPVSAYDGANKKYVDDKFGSIVIPNTTSFLVRTGDAMTGGNLTLFNEPTQNKHATSKFYVDTLAATVSANLLSIISNNSAFIPLAGGTMTNGFITAASDYPTQARHLSTKKYIDDYFVPIAGGKTITGSLFFSTDYTANATNNLIFSTKKYVDDKFNAIPLGSYLPLAGGTMTGPLVIHSFSEKVVAATAASTTTLDLNLANTFTINLTTDITSFSFSNIPSNSFSVTLIITQNRIPGASITWNVGATPIKWENGNKPTMSTASNAVDIVVITRIGNTYFGFNGGQNFL